MINFSHSRTIHQSLEEYGRGIAGGIMFSLPLLYTMEVWDAGLLLTPLRLLLFTCFIFMLLLLYNRFAGLREDAGWTEVFIDSVEEFGIGLVISSIILWLTGRITGDMSHREVLGKITVEAMTVAIGVSVGTAQLGVPSEDEGTARENRDNNLFSSQLAIALCGAFLFAANIAPTDEIMIIATEATPVKLILIVLASLLLSTLILRFSGFLNARLSSDDGMVKTIRAVVITYAIAVVASGVSLWFFGKLDGDPPGLVISKLVTLGFASTLGASAGRLLLQNKQPEP